MRVYSRFVLPPILNLVMPGPAPARAAGAAGAESARRGAARWQQRLTPFWRPLAGGCHLDREMDALLRAAFPIVELETSYLEGPRILTYMYEGRARS